MVSRMDRDIGRIMAKVADLGLDDNTLIMFSSDNGPHVEGGADPKFFNSGGGLTGTKRSLTEGGIRAPMIARWPGKIKPGSVTHHISAHWDLLPTCAEIGGGKAPDKIDGISFLPTLLGKDGQSEHKYLYWEFLEQGGKQAIRKGNWKAIRLDVGKNEDAPIHLYNLATDLKEQNDIAKDHPEVVAEMAALFKEAHVEGGDDYKLFPSEKKNRKNKSSKPGAGKKLAPKGKQAA
jgi:arylsulfatase A-like enzyme